MAALVIEREIESLWPDMAVQKYTLRIDAAHKGVRLDQFLGFSLPGALDREVSPGQVRKLIESGVVSLNGRPERLISRPLLVGARVEVVVDVARFSKGGGAEASRPVARRFEFGPAQVLFEDEWLIAVDKPAGMPTQPTLDVSRVNVFGALKDYLQKRDGGTPYLGLHHRLDRDTSGVVLFTKDQKANAGVTAMFSSRGIQKTYLALCQAVGSVPDSWEVKNYLGVVARAGKSSKFGAVRSGGDPAHTTFKVLERFAGALMVEARPHTGRTHQIRVHLAEGGLPILGDSFYGGPMDLRLKTGVSLHSARVMLHAAALEFSHPVTNALARIRSAAPADFEACSKQLRSASAALA